MSTVFCHPQLFPNQRQRMPELLRVLCNYTRTSQDLGMHDGILPTTESYEQLIDNWYQQVREAFYWYIAQFIEWQTNKLIYGKSEETRKRFAYV